MSLRLQIISSLHFVNLRCSIQHTTFNRMNYIEYVMVRHIIQTTSDNHFIGLAHNVVVTFYKLKMQYSTHGI